MSSLYQEAKALFEACMDQPSQLWPQILDQASCAEVRTRTQQLLKAFQQTAKNYTELVDARSGRALPVLSPGLELDDFKIIDCLGQGGSGAVYLAKQQSIDRLVALKISTRLNVTEANILAKVNHPHIVQVYSVSTLQWQGRKLYGICMQYVSGRSLRDLLDDAPSTLSRNPQALKFVLSMGRDIALALRYAHRHSLLHLDVKPENILYDGQGKFLLADFNISMNKEDIDLDRLGGSFNYMAPEQRALFEKSSEASVNLTERSDIYALGKVIAEAAAKLGVAGDPPITALVQRATEQNPEERFSDVKQFLESIDIHLELLNSGITSEGGAFERFRAWIIKHPWTSILGSVIIPNVFSSILQVQYNALYILSGLTETHRERFQNLLLPINLSLYLLAAWLLRLYFLPVVRGIKASAANQSVLEDALPAIGRAIRFMSFFTIIFWTIGYFGFTEGLGQPPLSSTQRSHFVLSFLLSVSVALSLSRLFISYLGFAVFYPNIMKKMATFGTIHHIPNVRGLKYSSGIVSMLGTLVVLVLGSGQSDYPVQILATTFLVGGTLAFIIGAEITDQIKASWQTLTFVTTRTKSGTPRFET